MPDLAQAVRVSPFALEPYRLAVGPVARPGAPGASGIGADWFGPLQPLAPIAPKEVAGRQFDYPPGFNLTTRPRAYEPIGFGELRALADTYDLIRIIIETRKDQMTRLEWNVRPREGRLAAGDPRVRQIEAFFARPDGARGWEPWLRELLEDVFVIDAPALWCERSRSGALLHLHPIDGASLKRVIDDWGRTPAPPLPAYQQVLHGMPAVDYTTRDILYRPRNSRVHKVYGFSPVEQILVTVNIALRRQIALLQYYTEGNIPEALIGAPESWTPEQIERFQLYWDGLYTGNTAQRRHAKFVPGGLAKTFIPTKEPELTGAADEWLARVCCFAFSVSPQPFVRMMNRATAEDAQEQAIAEGMAPLQQWVKGLCDHVIAHEFGAGDLEFRWKDDLASDQASVASVAADYVKTGIKSVNEVRGELGLDPVPGGELPMVLTAQGPVALGTAGTQGAAKFARFNPNHYGPGPQGGQFAPSGEDGASVGGAGSADDGPSTSEAVQIAAATGPTANLSADELAGGHTIGQHVGKSLEFLQNRLGETPTLRATSTYRDLAEANTVTQRLFDANQSQIDSWLSDANGNDRLVIDAVWPVTSPGYVPVGSVLMRGTAGLVPGNGARAVLQLDSDLPNGFVVITSYPMFIGIPGGD